MWAVGIIGVVVVAALAVLGWMIYVKRQRVAEAQRIYELNIARDTARIVEEHRREEIARSWEEFDQQEWNKRFKA